MTMDVSRCSDVRDLFAIALTFQGWPGTEPATATAAESTSEDCQSDRGAEFALPWILDPPEQNYVEVHPGAERLLSVDNRLHGGECKLVLTLADGTEIESDTWTEPGT